MYQDREGASGGSILPGVSGIPDESIARPNWPAPGHPAPSSPDQRTSTIATPEQPPAADKSDKTLDTGVRSKTPEIPEHELRLQEAKQKLDGKKIILNEKVSRFKGLFNIIKAAVDIASDVSTRSAIPSNIR